MWHGTGTNPDVFYPRNLVLQDWPISRSGSEISLDRVMTPVVHRRFADAEDAVGDILGCYT